jgi:hypothetical protein
VAPPKSGITRSSTSTPSRYCVKPRSATGFIISSPKRT